MGTTVHKLLCNMLICSYIHISCEVVQYVPFSDKIYVMSVRKALRGKSRGLGEGYTCT